eukprot:553847-Pleurochrysis_carterae.AAC.1
MARLATALAALTVSQAIVDGGDGGGGGGGGDGGGSGGGGVGGEQQVGVVRGGGGTGGSGDGTTACVGAATRAGSET